MRTGRTRKRIRQDGFDFFISPFFPVFLATIAFFCWFFGRGAWGIVLFCAAAGFILAFCEDMTPIIAVLFMLIQVSDKPHLQDMPWWMYAISGAFFVAGFAARIRFFVRDKGTHSFFGLSCAALLCAVALGGFGVATRENPDFAFFTVVFCVGAAVFILSADRSVGKIYRKKSVGFVCAVVISSSLLCAAQLISLFVGSADGFAIIGAKDALDVGYGSANQAANILVRAIPPTVFLASRDKPFSCLWHLISCFFFAVAALTFSRASLLMSLFVWFLSFLYFGIKSQRKGIYFVSFVITVSVTAVVMNEIVGRVPGLWDRIVSKGLDDSGRIGIWERGMATFSEHPLFGAGLDYRFGQMRPNEPYWYHNTLVQTAACFGAVGCVCLAVYLAAQYSSFWLADDKAAKALLFVVASMQIISLLDVHFYTPQDFLEMAFLTFAARPRPTDADFFSRRRLKLRKSSVSANFPY